jgi:hypothetical protein
MMRLCYAEDTNVGEEGVMGTDSIATNLAKIQMSEMHKRVLIVW